MQTIDEVKKHCRFVGARAVLVAAAALAFACVLVACRAKQDAYSTDDPKTGLEELKKKWPKAVTRLSQWSMPQHADEIRRLNALVKAFESDRARFAARLERGCREILGSLVDPQVWNYNLACALAAQGRREEAFDAFEQAVVAGFGTANRDFGPSSDVSLAPLTNDVRFAKLVAMMRADDRPDWTRPAQVAEVVSGVIHLGEEFVRYGVEDGAFMVLVKPDDDCPVVYVNKHMDHPDVPDCPFVRAAYSRGAKMTSMPALVTVSFAD